MRTVFADTVYWIALLNPKDQAHHLAVTVSQRLGAVRIVTTEAVLIEFLNYFAARGPFFRQAAGQLLERMQVDRSIHIVPQTREDFLAGYRLYQARPDKGYSLTDCLSMIIMRREGLCDVLTHDAHFQQEGFFCLLRE